MDNGVTVLKIKLIGFPDVTLRDSEIRMRLEMVAKPHDVKGCDLIAEREKFRNQDGSFVAAGACYKDAF